MKRIFGVEVFALTAMRDEVIESGSLRIVLLAHMPLADVRRRVPCPLQLAWEARHIGRILGEVVEHLVSVGVQAAED
jgi:hypothetical protein